MCENPQNIIRSWNVQTAFSGGPVTYNKLVPPKYGRIMYNYVQTWREVNAGLGDLDWGAEYFSFYLPKGIRILGAMYLRIQLPEVSGATYKPYPGLYPIKDIRIQAATGLPGPVHHVFGGPHAESHRALRQGVR